MFQKPSTLAAVTHISDPLEYHNLGTDKERGHPERVISRSQLWDMAPALRKWKRGIGERKTRSMDFGSLVDCLALTPDQFEVMYSVTPETYGDEGKPWNWNATACKVWRTAREGEGRLCVKPSDLAEAKIAAAAYERKRLKAFRDASDTQVMVCADWHDEETGLIVPVRCLIDLMPAPGSEFGDTLADLKTTKSAEYNSWRKSVFYEGKHFQAAVYLDVVNAATGLKYRRFEHHIIENSAPYESTWRELSDDLITIGRNHYQTTIRQYCMALKTGKWPGFDTAIVEPESWMI